MLKLNQIIAQLVEEFQTVVIKDYPDEKNINRVEVLSPYTVFDKDTLYLCQDPDLLAQDGFINPLPKDCSKYYVLTGLKNDSPFSMIRISKKISSRQLFLKLNAFLKYEDLLEKQVAELYHCLYEGLGLNGIVTKAEQFLNFPISVCDSSYNMIETSPLMKKMPYGMEQNKSHVYLNNSEIESLKRYKVIDKIYATDSAFSIVTPDHPDNHWIFAAIRIQKVMTGFVAICTGKQAPDDYELRIASTLSDICAIEMQKHEFFLTRTGLKYENFLFDLLEGKFNDVNLVHSRMELLDKKINDYFCLLVFSCTEPHDSKIFNNTHISALRRHFKDSMSVVYQDRVVFFLNQTEPVLFTENFFAPVAEVASLNHMNVGISQPFRDILKTKDFYRQAADTIYLGLKYLPGETLYFADRLTPYALFSGNSYEKLSASIHYMIYLLQEYDREFHTEFLLTLRSYLENDRNATKTAEALHIHRSTFFYRVKKIEELLHISITDSRQLLLFELSFAIWDYLA